MRELNTALSEVELNRLLGFREDNITRAITNKSENLVSSLLPNSLKGKKITWERQYLIGYRILDFYCPELKIAIEVDGTEHDRQYDRYRDEYLFRVENIITFRVRNNTPLDIKSVLDTLPLCMKCGSNRNIVFKDVLGVNPTHVAKERLSRTIPFKEEYLLLGKYLNSRGYRSEYQTYLAYKKSHWINLCKSLKKNGVEYKNQKDRLYTALNSLGVKLLSYHSSYLIGEYDPIILSRFKKKKEIDTNMVIYRKDDTFYCRGVEGKGLKSFLEITGYRLKDQDLMERAHNPYKVFGDKVNSFRGGEKPLITLCDYMVKRSGNSKSFAITNEEANAFNISTAKRGWATRYKNNTIDSQTAIELIRQVLKKDISSFVKQNLQTYLTELTK